MQLEEYFDFSSPPDILIRGTRVPVVSVVREYKAKRRTPEQLTRRFPTLTIEQVYATILYYLRNRAAVDDLIRELDEWYDQMEEEQARNPHAGIVRLRQLLAERDAQQSPA